MACASRVSMCAVCGDELLTRAGVEALVRGEEEVVLDRKFMRWDTYSSGSAFIFAEIGGVTGSRGETKNVVCGCNVRHAATPALTMIREEFRDVILAKFGSEFTVPFLFRLPVSMVAWENSAFVMYEPAKEGLRLSGDGVRMIEMIVEMSKMGFFNGSLSYYSEETVVSGFSYLHMVKARYRSLVAVQFGSEVSIADFFSRVELEWLDWPAMATLNCEVADGMLQVVPTSGTPLVQGLYEGIVAAYQLPEAEVFPGVPARNPCFQVVPGGESLYGTQVRTDVPAVELRSGTAFIPSGPVVLQASKMALIFEPGVRVEVAGGTVLQAPLGAVTLFVDGIVAVNLISTVVGRPREAFGGFVRQFQVSVVCRSYDGGGPYAKWYKKLIDPTSTDARFFCCTAQVIVLYSPSVSAKGAYSLEMRDEEGVATGDGVTTYQCDGGEGDKGARYVLRHPGPFTVSAVRVPDSFKRQTVLNGVVRLTTASSVGVLRRGVLEVVRYKPMDQGWFSVADSFVSEFALKCAVVGDDYMLDGGGPSDTDGFDDELETWFKSEVAEALLYRASNGRYPSYTRVAHDPGSLVRMLGMSPTMAEFMRVDAELINIARLEETGWRRTDLGYWIVVDVRKATLSWADLAAMVASWVTVESAAGSLTALLFSRYSTGTVMPCLFSRCG